MPQLQMMADTRDAQPQQVFINKINELIFGNDVRFLSAKPKDLDFMNKEQSANLRNALETPQTLLILSLEI